MRLTANHPRVQVSTHFLELESVQQDFLIRPIVSVEAADVIADQRFALLAKRALLIPRPLDAGLEFGTVGRAVRVQSKSPGRLQRSALAAAEDGRGSCRGDSFVCSHFGNRQPVRQDEW